MTKVIGPASGKRRFAHKRESESQPSVTNARSVRVTHKLLQRYDVVRYLAVSPKWPKVGTLSPRRGFVSSTTTLSVLSATSRRVQALANVAELAEVARRLWNSLALCRQIPQSALKEESKS